jgi:hypothetical protein
MAKRKDFSLGQISPEKIVLLQTVNPEAILKTSFQLNAQNGRNKVFDFSRFFQRGIDEIASACVQSLDLLQQNNLEEETVRGAANSIMDFLSFCASACENQKEKKLDLDWVSKIGIRLYVSYVKQKKMRSGEFLSPNSQRSIYAKVAIVLKDLQNRRLLKGTNLFPVNPFPGSTAKSNSTRIIEQLSRVEKKSVVEALAKEMFLIYDEEHSASIRIQFGIGILSIMLKTGTNLTPVLEICRIEDRVLFPHPFVNRLVFRTVKRRGATERNLPLQEEVFKTSPIDVARIYRHFLSKTETLAGCNAASPITYYLWIYKSNGNLTRMSMQDVVSAARYLQNKYQLFRDDGSPLLIGAQMLRNSFGNRIWALSGGSLANTAASLGDTLQVASGYLAVSNEMLSEHKFAGEIMIANLRSDAFSSVATTPVASCADTINGDLAPKTGESCVDFLSCFRCKSQRIAEQDLYRLFSFYWAVLFERDRIGSKIWRKNFAWILRVIERDIVPKFSSHVVSKEKEKARTNPHPMWRSIDMLKVLKGLL